MADPIPVNSRRDRNPPIPPRPNPFAAGGMLGGALPNRPELLNNPAIGGAERPRADAAPNRPANPVRPGAPPAQVQRAPRQRRQAMSQDVRDRLERGMLVITAAVLVLLILLSSRTAPPPSSVTPYAPRDISAAQPLPTAVVQPMTSTTLALVPAYTTRRDLVRTCPRTECMPISDQPIIENNTGVFARGQSADGRWIAISAPDMRWNGWVSVDIIRLTQPGAALPVLPG